MRYKQALTQHNALVGLREKDEKTRSTMAQFMRSGYSQGDAMKKAESKLENYWTLPLEPLRGTSPAAAQDTNSIARQAANIARRGGGVC